MIPEVAWDRCYQLIMWDQFATFGASPGPLTNLPEANPLLKNFSFKKLLGTHRVRKIASPIHRYDGRSHRVSYAETLQKPIK